MLSPLFLTPPHSVCQFLSRCQSPQGGFGGGPGQHPHLAPTYAAVNALCIIGTEEAFGVIDRYGRRLEGVCGGLSQPARGRGEAGCVCVHVPPSFSQLAGSCRKKLLEYLHSLKQPDGSFLMHVGGEVDVRWASAAGCGGGKTAGCRGGGAGATALSACLPQERLLCRLRGLADQHPHSGALCRDGRVDSEVRAGVHGGRVGDRGRPCASATS